MVMAREARRHKAKFDSSDQNISSVNQDGVPDERPVEQSILELNRLIFLRPRDPKLFARRGEAFSQLYDLSWSAWCSPNLKYRTFLGNRQSSTSVM